MTSSKKLADGILFASGLTAVACVPFLGHPAGMWGFVASEAVFVASFADWFAVTALFRRPMGIGFHTDVIRAQHATIGDGLSSFVKGKLLSRQEIERLVSNYDFAGELVAHIDGDGRADLVDKIVDVLQSTMATPGDKVVDAIHVSLKSAVSNVRLAPILSHYLETWTKSPRFATDVDLLFEALKRNRTSIMKGIDGDVVRAYEEMGSIKSTAIRTVLHERELTRIICDSIDNVIESESIRNDLRASIEGVVSKLNSDLQRRESKLAVSVEELKEVLFSRIDLKQEIRVLLKRLAGSATKEEMRERVDSLLLRVSATLGAEEKAMAINATLRKLISDNTELLHAAIDSLIAHVFKNQLSPDELVKFIEANLGEQLHGIRVRGAVVGLFVGVLLGVITSLT